jgi:succinate dehydrogenase/fumarate reductase flavoprotein subunit
VVPGSFGTFAGLAVDERARVVDAEGAAIPGLYAVGADQANVMGGHYPAGGVNIGPAMTFGYVAGRDLAGAAGFETEAVSMPTSGRRLRPTHPSLETGAQA